MRRRSRCVGLLGEEVLVCLAEWDQHLVRVRWKGIQMIPGLEGPTPFQCQWSDMSYQSWMRHPLLDFQVEAAQGLGVERVVADHLVGVEKEEDQR